MLTEFVKVASVNDLADDNMISCVVDSEEVVLAKIGGEYYALDGWCSHEAGLLAEGYLHADTCEVECPVHEGFFSFKSGNATAPPAEDPVACYAVRIEGDDILVGPKE